MTKFKNTCQSELLYKREKLVHGLNSDMFLSGTKQHYSCGAGRQFRCKCIESGPFIKVENLQVLL